MQPTRNAAESQPDPEWTVVGSIFASDYLALAQQGGGLMGVSASKFFT